MFNTHGAVIVKHIAFLLFGAFAGWLYDEPAIGVALAAIVALGWHIFHLLKMQAWLQSAKSQHLPSGSGPWPSVFSAVHHLRGRMKRAKRRHRKSTRAWRDITNALPDGGLLLNDEFEIVQFNDVAVQMLKLDTTQDVGQRITNIIRNPRFAVLFEQKIYAKPVQIQTINNPGRTFSCQIRPLGNKQFLLIVRDVSERLLAEKMRTDFVANAAHELRTPLTVLNGYLTSMADDDSFDAHWRSPISEMSAQLERMRALVTDLLTLNELESQSPAPLTEVDIGQLITRAGEDARQLSDEATSVNIDMNIDSNVLLRGDAQALRSIVTNLLSNAVRYTPAGGRVMVSWASDRDGAALVVADTGVGIEAEDIARITERFYRADAGRARAAGGTGLGLAIVKHALSVHDGQLLIASEPGKGSTFTCRFPPARVASAAPGDIPSA